MSSNYQASRLEAELPIMRHSAIIEVKTNQQRGIIMATKPKRPEPKPKKKKKQSYK